MAELEIQALRSSFCLKMKLRRWAISPEFHLVLNDFWEYENMA